MYFFLILYYFLSSLLFGKYKKGILDRTIHLFLKDICESFIVGCCTCLEDLVILFNCNCLVFSRFIFLYSCKEEKYLPTRNRKPIFLAAGAAIVEIC